MLLFKFVVFVTLIGGPCLCKIAIEVKKLDGFVEIEKAAIKLLTTCYGERDKTIVVLGEFPGKFVERLTSNKSFSVVLLDYRRREENNVPENAAVDHNRRHKVNVFVMMASNPKQSSKMILRMNKSHYANHKAYYLIICWSKEMHFGKKTNVLSLLHNANVNYIMNGNVMFHDRRKGVILYSSNPFTDKAPKPWKFVESFSLRQGIFLFYSYFVRENRKNEDICKNLEFNREHDAGGLAIPILTNPFTVRMSTQTGIIPQYDKRDRRTLIAWSKLINPIVKSIRKVNGTLKYRGVDRDERLIRTQSSINPRKALLRIVHPTETASYPRATICQHLLTQSRGNKSQLRKIYETIDGYSWIGMCIVYLITLIFFKFFMRLPISAGVFNLLRLTCNTGLPAPPSSRSSRIYLGCLLFFVVTMQGIFTGNLASLLTHDIPLQQVNSFQDLVDFGYTLSIIKRDSLYMDFPTYQGHLHFAFHKEFNDCPDFVSIDPLNACLSSNEPSINKAIDLGFHVSSCITAEIVAHRLPWHFFLENEFNKIMGSQFEGGISLPFGLMVDEKRRIEHEAAEASAPLEPEIMTLEDLGFAFAILGFGMSCATVTFVAELIIHRYQRTTWTERVNIFESTRTSPESIRGAE